MITLRHTAPDRNPDDGVRITPPKLKDLAINNQTITPGHEPGNIRSSTGVRGAEITSRCIPVMIRS